MHIEVDDQIHLELTSEKHAEDLFSAVNNNRKHLSEFLPWVGSMATVQNTRDYIQSSLSLIKQGLEYSFMILYNDQLVGRIGLHHVNLNNRLGAIGYWLSKEAEGKGIIIKSCMAIINYGFKDLDLHRIEIKAATKNFKSQVIPEKLGFQKEGLLREAELVNGEYLDLFIYSMLSQDWGKK